MEKLVIFETVCDLSHKFSAKTSQTGLYANVCTEMFYKRCINMLARQQFDPWSLTTSQCCKKLKLKKQNTNYNSCFDLPFVFCLEVF